MEEQKDMLGLLDLMTQPAFCVKEDQILRLNPAARQLLLQAGDRISPLLLTGGEEYAQFSGGCLHLTLSLEGQSIGASVQRVEDMDVFVLEPEEDGCALRAMALAAAELRRPLADAMTGAAALLDSQADPQTLQRLNRSLYQMLRMVGNMADADVTGCRMETTDAVAFFREVFEKAQTLLSRSGITLVYEDWQETLCCLLDTRQLERAVLNLLSNAAKFTPKGGQITASLTRRGRTLYLSIQDSGSGIAQEVMGTLFRRYQRQPGIEDSRFGLGLGLKLIQNAAREHGGTLLVTPAEAGGTRIVLTLAIRQSRQSGLRSPVFSVDYTGGYDHALVELADCLSSELYDGSF